MLTARRDGVAVLLDLDREVYLTLDETGAVIWEELERGSSRADICRRLAAEFDAAEEILEQDADTFLRELHSRGLVECP
ncbi:MAG TPA: PqqD family protein [Longimicrobiales bacterium]|nr:PqqD family protein [Longimicrobiales bacterium]